MEKDIHITLVNGALDVDLFGGRLAYSVTLDNNLVSDMRKSWECED